MLSENFVDFCHVSLIAGNCKISAVTFEADKFADCLIANGVTIQKHGRWEIKADDDDYEYAMCPCCGEEFYDPNGEDTIDTFMNYCPNCGARMDADG